MKIRYPLMDKTLNALEALRGGVAQLQSTEKVPAESKDSQPKEVVEKPKKETDTPPVEKESAAAKFLKSKFSEAEAPKDEEKPVTKEIEKTDDVEKEISDETKETTDEPTEETSEAKDGELSDDDVLKIGKENLVDSNGKPVTIKSSEAFAIVKKKYAEAKEEIEKLRSQTSNPDLDKKFEELQKERDSLKKVVDTQFFRESEDFKKKYQDPIDQHTAKVEKLFQHVDKSKANELVSLAGEFSQLTSEKATFDEDNESKVIDIIDRMVDIMPATRGRKIAESMLEIYDLEKSKAEALSDSDKARQQMLAERSQISDATSQEFDSTVSRSFEIWEDANEGRLEFYRGVDGIDYDEVVESRKEVLEKGMRVLLKEGTVTPEFSKLLVEGAIAGEVFKRSEKVLADSLAKASSELEDLKKKNDELTAKLKKAGGSQDYGSDSSSEKDDEDKDISSAQFIKRKFSQLAS